HTRFSRDWSSDVCSSDLGASAVRTGMGGACEVMLLTWSRPPPRGPVLKPIIGQSVALAFLLFLTGLVIAGPLVRRIRKLQKEVEIGRASCRERERVAEAC